MLLLLLRLMPRRIPLLRAPAKWFSKRIVSNFSEEKNRRMAEAAEKMKSGDVDRKLLKFFAAIEGTNRFANIAKEWEAQGLSGDPLYSGIEADIEKRAKVERLYGPTHDNGRISAFIDSLKEQTGIVL